MKQNFLIAALLFSIGLYSQSIEMLQWEDLLVKHEHEDPYTDLPVDVRLNLMMAATGRQVLKTSREPASEAVQFRVDSLVNLITEQGIDIETIDRYHADMTRSFTNKTEKTRKELDGKLVGIPGYLLPLDKKDKLATEFLLVSWIGECIHKPRPKNQVIHVTVKDGYECRSDFESVMIEGRMTVADNISELHLEEGSATIPSGYSIVHGRIIPRPITEN